MEKQIIVIGGGAAGLTGAITAARMGGKVTILEHSKKPGQKILATGNGKCNLGNTYMDSSCYHSQNMDFVEEVLNRWPTQKTLDFFQSLGIYTRERNGGLYPYSQQAAAIRDALSMEAAFWKVKIKNNCEIEGLSTKNGKWQIYTPGWAYEADQVILATGSAASNIPGADHSGYQLASDLGHSVISPLPALVPLTCRGVSTREWAGVRIEGRISLMINGKKQAQEAGELQLTDYGISGIPVFQLSSQAVRSLHKGQQVELLVDLLPDMKEEELIHWLAIQRKNCPYKSEKELFLGLLPDKLIGLLPEDEPEKWLKNLRLTVTGCKSEKYAQVLSGGVDVGEIDPGTMESRLFRGLYFAGEIMDVDGICGGYNLHWAWATGSIAGRSSYDSD